VQSRKQTPSGLATGRVARVGFEVPYVDGARLRRRLLCPRRALSAREPGYSGAPGARRPRRPRMELIFAQGSSSAELGILRRAREASPIRSARFPKGQLPRDSRRHSLGPLDGSDCLVAPSLVLMAALVGAIRSDSPARADARPVGLEDRRSFERERLEAQSVERDILARGGILLAKMSGQLRGPKRTRRIRGQLKGGTGAPEPSRLGLLSSRWSRRSSSYQGLPRLYRRHVAPLATGPPGTVSGDRSQIARAIDPVALEKPQPADSAFRPRSPRGPP
jgi:hypothetical protein